MRPVYARTDQPFDPFNFGVYRFSLPMTMLQDVDGSECIASGTTLRELADRLRVRLDSSQDSTGVLLRAEVRIAPVPALAWLHAQQETTHYYWSSRDGDFEMAGVGEADVIVPEEHADLPGLFAGMRQRLSIEWPNLRYYGGFRFRDDQEDSGRWKNFKAYRFIAPQVEIVRCGSKTWLTCTVRKGTPESTAAALKRIEVLADQWGDPEHSPVCALPPLAGRVDLPDREGWNDLIDLALEAFAAREMEKVVLARETEFQYDTKLPLDAVGMLRRLVAHSSQAYVFCFHPKADRAFLGASPERLYYRNNVYLQSEALAGTRPRGGTPEEDRALGEELLGDDKELREHRFVVRMLRENFGRFCSSMSYDLAPSLMKLRNVQHLYSYIEGILKDHDADAALIEAFHPTPAVGGAPRHKALAWLAAHEPFDRGVYAAPVGWVGFDDAEFCVGIRSGLIEGNTLALYSGAGIVPGSSAAAEWNEIENKMSNFLEALYAEPS